MNTQVSFHACPIKPADVSKIGSAVFFNGEYALCASMKFFDVASKHDYVEVVQYSSDKQALIGWLEGIIEEASESIKKLQAHNPKLVNVDSQS